MYFAISTKLKLLKTIIGHILLNVRIRPHDGGCVLIGWIDIENVSSTVNFINFFICRKYSQ